MKETQNIEFKESRRDEYLKWICGQANAQGGKIYIGVNDDGEVVGVSDAKKLMESVPNKVRDYLGIVVDVNLLRQGDKEYLEIKTPSSTYPINYKGQYHYRSGSTKQQLNGVSLTNFLFDKLGVKWEDYPISNASIDDLDEESFKIFNREALRIKRLTEEDFSVTRIQLLDNLGLIVDGKLTRAGVLLFHPHPERWIAGAYIKVGKFGIGSDLQYQDEISGSLINQADKVIDLIFFKYLKAHISYEHDKRVETYPFVREAIREAVYNAIIHKQYFSGIPIQIRIEDTAMYISNDSVLPKGWTKETLMNEHRSIPYNPHIANVFYRAGYIESWGRGIQKICEACKEAGADNPEYIVSKYDMRVKFNAMEFEKNNENVVSSYHLTLLENNIIELIQRNPRITQKEIVEEIGVSRRSVQRAFVNLKSNKIIERSGNNRKGYWKIN
ncbi:MAG: putative DNA binding domain-containing protein [Erysipelotrichaceae bacterium]|nr:putative DNA binding domain-containing protein [Erysipelotrichaceae bacterium]